MLALEKTDTNDINIFPTENAGDSAVTNLKIKLLKKKKTLKRIAHIHRKLRKQMYHCYQTLGFPTEIGKKRKKAHFPFHSHFEEIISLQLRLTF